MLVTVLLPILTCKVIHVVISIGKHEDHRMPVLSKKKNKIVSWRGRCVKM